MSTADELAKLRIKEEAEKIISQTSRSRKLKQRELIGNEAEEIHARKDHVEDAKKVWSVKGTEAQSHGKEDIEQNVASSAKSAYEDKVKEFNSIGATPEPIFDYSNVQESPLKHKAKLGLSADDMPSLFGGGKTASKQPKDSTMSNSTTYTDGFAKIEKVEERMEGLNKHITTTGWDAAGRKVTKTKIILPEQVGETKAQHQAGKSPEEANNALLPSTWDGTYYSLTDIRQRKVEGIDKNNREQYLSPEDFEATFKMTKEAFSKLPKWKRDGMKRDLHLF